MTVKQIENEILKKHLPFWMGIKDEKFGGCFGYMDGRGKIDETADKSVLLVSRCLYFFSEVYTVYPDPQVREIAESYYQYINAHYLDADGGIIYSVSFDGKVKDETKNVYFHAFVIYAFMKYYQAFRKKEALKKALKLFYFIEDKFRAKVAYNEQLYSAARSENMIADKGVKCYKTMNSLLHILESYTPLYRFSGSAAVGAALKRLLLLFNEKIYSPQKGRLEVFFDDDLNSISEYHSYGHDIEASWLLDLAAETLGEEGLIEKTHRMTDHLCSTVYKEGFDGEAVYNEKVNGVLDPDRIWWVQAEAVLGFYKNYERTGNLRYKETSEKIVDYIFRYIISEDLDWYWKVDVKNCPDNVLPMVSAWKCPYHSGRMLLEMLRADMSVRKRETELEGAGA